MSIDPKKLNKNGGDTVYLTEEVNGYPAGTALVTRKTMELKGQTVVMVADGNPDSRAFAINDLSKLSLTSPDGAATDDAEGDTALEGPVYDYFQAYSDLNNEVVQAFMVEYISNNGTDDLESLEMLLALNDLQVGETLSVEQVAQLYSSLMETTGQDVPEEVTAILNPTKPDPKAAAKAKAEANKKAADDKKKAEANKKEEPKPAPKAAAKDETPATVDKASWTPLKMDALTLTGAMLPIFAANPDNFDEVVAFAVRQVKAAAAVPNPKSK